MGTQDRSRDVKQAETKMNEGALTSDAYEDNEKELTLLRRWKEVKTAAVNAGAEAVLQKAIANLSKAGLNHAASWVRTVGYSIDPSVDDKAKMFRQYATQLKFQGF